jgi:hypothetical protein
LAFPKEVKDFNLVVAAINPDGTSSFIDSCKPLTAEQEGVFEAAWFWTVEDRHSLGAFGSPSKALAVAGKGGSTFGIMRFPARSAGQMDVAATSEGSLVDGHHHGDPSMHATHTIDYEIILSGKIDFALPSGEKRTLSTGDLIVVAGAPHAWLNPYDEDCIYAAITIGAEV